MTKIKFCGVTREQDAAAAAAAGAAMVGFVLWPDSPRGIDVARARTLIARLPPETTPVGVFVRPSPDEIARAVEYAGIRIAQVHGVANIAGLDRAGGAGCALWLAATLAGDALDPPVDDEVTVLLDAGDAVRFGGTGRTIDWAAAARIAARRPVVLAGGLTPANVAAAVRQVRPFAVDVASGIEERPGVKDARAMRAFVAAVREAEQ